MKLNGPPAFVLSSLVWTPPLSTPRLLEKEEGRAS